MLILKLLLVPVLLALVTIAARRWGPTRGGTLAGMPWVVGPILLVLLLERGPGFAADASIAAFLSVPASVVFLLALAHAAGRTGLPLALMLGVCGWSVTGIAFVVWPPALWLAVAINLSLLLMLPRLMPVSAESTRVTQQIDPARGARVDLIARMVAGAMLTLLVSAIAGLVGTRFSGLLAAFPVITVVLGAMSWLRYGSPYMVTLFRGMTLGYFSLATFSLALALFLRALPPAPAFLGTCLVTVLVHWLAVALHKPVPAIKPV